MQRLVAPQLRPTPRSLTAFLLFFALLMLALSLVAPTPAAAGVAECRSAAVRAAGTFTKKRARQMLACSSAGGCDAATSDTQSERARRRGVRALDLSCADVSAAELGFGDVCPDPTGRCAQALDSHDALVDCLLCMVAETVEPLIRRLDGVPSGVAESCGGCAAGRCEPGSYCEPPAGSCEETPEVGACARIPEACLQLFAPVCGCDGVTYANDCVRRQHRTGLLHPGACKAQCAGTDGEGCPDGTFCDGLPGRCDVASATSTEVPSDGGCVPIPAVCAEIYHPVCGCDGVTYGNDCERRAAAVGLAHDGPCEVGCGLLVPGSSGEPIAVGVCGDGSYCELPPGLCDDVGVPGICLPKPDQCPAIVAPVCGCDGRTYTNDCARMAAGVAKREDGTCREPCGGFAGVTCVQGEQCELPAGQCDSADVQGRCIETPVGCPDHVDPVCGCDGRTYSNDCDRRAAGVQLDHDGPCPQPCDGDTPCKQDQVCLPPAGVCDAGAGVCNPIPTTCPLAAAPFPLLAVCGCDGRTYDSLCEATRAAVAIAHAGPCESDLPCIADADCRSGELCLPIPGLCLLVAGPGAGSDPTTAAPIAPSICTPVPAECPPDDLPVCGCDLLDYPSVCEANRAGAGVAYPGSCAGAPPP